VRSLAGRAVIVRAEAPSLTSKMLSRIPPFGGAEHTVSIDVEPLQDSSMPLVGVTAGAEPTDRLASLGRLERVHEPPEMLDAHLL